VSVAALLIFALALFVVAGSPGPAIAALVARVLSRGLRDVAPFLAGMWIGEAAWLTCAVAGLTVLAQSFSALFLAIKYLGAAYLLLLAARMWFAPAEVAAGELPAAQKPWRLLLGGMAVTLGNPKIMVFYVALLPTLVDISHVGLLSWAELTLTMLVVLAATDLTWAVLAARARRLLTSRRAVTIANRASATMMAGAAAAIATR